MRAESVGLDESDLCRWAGRREWRTGHRVPAAGYSSRRASCRVVTTCGVRHRSHSNGSVNQAGFQWSRASMAPWISFNRAGPSSAGRIAAEHRFGARALNASSQRCVPTKCSVLMLRTVEEQSEPPTDRWTDRVSRFSLLSAESIVGSRNRRCGRMFA